MRGDIQFSGRLYVSGSVEGTIATAEGISATLFVDEGGSVEGEIRVAHVVVAGRVEGTVLAEERLDITATGEVQGEVSYKQLGVELGGCVNGTVRRVREDEAAATFGSSSCRARVNETREAAL